MASLGTFSDTIHTQQRLGFTPTPLIDHTFDMERKCNFLHVVAFYLFILYKKRCKKIGRVVAWSKSGAWLAFDTSTHTQFSCRPNIF